MSKLQIQTQRPAGEMKQFNHARNRCMDTVAAACSHADPRVPGFWPAGSLTLIRSSFACGGGVGIDGKASPREGDQGRLKKPEALRCWD